MAGAVVHSIVRFACVGHVVVSRKSKVESEDVVSIST